MATLLTSRQSPAVGAVEFPTILVADDDPAIIQMVSTVLEEQGYRVLQAHNGLEALGATEGCSEVVDLLISDLEMPEMDGNALLAEWRRRNPHARAVLMSGHGGSAAVPDVPFLTKPFTASELVSVVKGVLAALSFSA